MFQHMKNIFFYRIPVMTLSIIRIFDHSRILSTTSDTLRLHEDTTPFIVYNERCNVFRILGFLLLYCFACIYYTSRFLLNHSVLRKPYENRIKIRYVVQVEFILRSFLTHLKTLYYLDKLKVVILPQFLIIILEYHCLRKHLPLLCIK